MPRGGDPPSTPRRYWSCAVACLAGGVDVLALAVATFRFCVLRSAFDAQGGRPPFDPPPVLVLRWLRAWPGVWSCLRWLLPRSGRSAFCVLRLMPRGGDPPSTPRRYWSCAGCVLGRGCGVACVGCCHVPGVLPSAFCVLRLMPRGGDPPSTPRRCWWLGESCLAGGVDVLALAVATFRAFCVLRSAFDAQGGRPPFDPPPVPVAGWSRAWPGV